MIKVSELRIGNKVIVRNSEYTGGHPTGAIITKEIEVFAIIKHPISAPDKRPVIMFKDGDSLCEHFLNDDIMPIPLTHEWLERFGYVKDTTDKKWYKLPHHLPPIYQWKAGAFGMDGLPLNVKSLEYVHQLQNLYFALTGEELTIKE